MNDKTENDEQNAELRGIARETTGKIGEQLLRNALESGMATAQMASFLDQMGKTKWMREIILAALQKAAEPLEFQLAVARRQVEQRKRNELSLSQARDVAQEERDQLKADVERLAGEIAVAEEALRGLLNGYSQVFDMWVKRQHDPEKRRALWFDKAPEVVAAREAIERQREGEEGK